MATAKVVAVMGAAQPRPQADGQAWRYGHLIASDPVLDQAAKGVVSCNTLLRQAEVVSLYLPLLPSAKGLIIAAAAEKMKPGAILIDTGRGRLVDEAAGTDALRAGTLGDARVDVPAAENVDMSNPLSNNSLPLSEVPNLVVAPHVGGQTEEELSRVGLAAVADVQAVLSGGRPQHPVRDIAMSDLTK